MPEPFFGSSKLTMTSRCLHYLDDYFFAVPTGSPHCQQHIQQFLLACDRLGFPVAHDKTEGPTTTLTFLGILIDSHLQQLRLPTDKLVPLCTEITAWLRRCTATKREVLSIVGKLSFAARVVPAGRLFLRRLIQLSTTAKCLHHHLRLNTETRADLQWWYDFLPSWNGVAMFINPDWTDADSLHLYTDASGMLGYGAVFRCQWIRSDWAPHQLPPHVSIQWQELFAVLAAAITWGHLWQGKRIRFNCDNLAIIHTWNGMSARHPALNRLFRCLFLTAAQNQFTVSLKHLPGKSNALADALSRNQLTRFFSLFPQANRLPTPLPAELTTI